MIRILALVAAVALTGYALHLLAQPRIDTRTAVTPIARWSSSGVSFASCYGPADRAVYLCRASPGDTVECKARTTLP